MRNKKTLYDLLEVSQSASQESIRAAWERIEAKHEKGALHSSEGLSDEANFNLIKDAFFTLADAKRRAEYDRKLAGPTLGAAAAYVEAEPGMSMMAKTIIALLVIGALVIGYKWHLGMEQERLRVQAELVRLEQQRLEQEREDRARIEEQQLAQRASEQAQREEYEKRRERETAISEAERNTRRLESAESRYRREDEIRQRNEERERRQQAYDAERNLRELQSKARQVDKQYDRGSATRGGGIPLQSASSSRRY